MSKYRYLTVLLALSLAFCLSSCFKDEPLNAECDIEQAYLRAGDHLGSWFLFDSDTLRNVQSDQTTIEFTMSGQADLTRLAPYFRISPGATISPASGSVHDFSQGAVEYTVTSEDGQWTRTYLVSIKKMIEFGSAHSTLSTATWTRDFMFGPNRGRIRTDRSRRSRFGPRATRATKSATVRRRRKTIPRRPPMRDTRARACAL